MTSTPALQDSHDPHSHQRGLLLVATAALLWSSSGLFIKVLPFGPLAIAGWRSLVAALAMLGFRRLQGRPADLGLSGLDLACAACYASVLMSFVAATKLTTAANAIFLQFSAPIYLLAIEPWVFRRPRSQRDTWAVAACVGGMGLFFFGKLDAGGRLGNLLGVVSGVFLACFTLLLKVKRLRQPHRDPAGAIILGNLLLALVCLPWSLREIPTAPTHLGILLFLGIFQLGLAYLFFSSGLRRVSATAATITSMLEAVFNPIWVFIGLGERPSGFALAGALVVVSVIVWYTLQPRPLSAPGAPEA